MRHVVNPGTKEWYHLDENNMVWTCPCLDGEPHKVSLCITVTEDLKKEGILRELDREIANKRKQLGFLQTETLEEGFKRLLGVENLSEPK